MGDAEDKETIHIELDLGESGLKYIVGDSLGVLPTNHSVEVDAVIRALNVSPTMKVQVPSWKYQQPIESIESSVTLREALIKYYDLKNLKPKA